MFAQQWCFLNGVLQKPPESFSDKAWEKEKERRREGIILSAADENEMRIW